MKFIKTTIIGGVLFLVPVVVAFIVVQKAYDLMLKVAKPLADDIPIDTVAGVALVNLLAGLIVILVCFLAGLLSQSKLAKQLSGVLDAKLRAAIPGCAMVRGIAENLRSETESAMRPVLVHFEDYERIGMAQEGQQGDKIAVYLPNSPNPWTGTVAVFDRKRVTLIPGHLKPVLESLEGFGDGVAEMLSDENRLT